MQRPRSAGPTRRRRRNNNNNQQKKQPFSIVNNNGYSNNNKNNPKQKISTTTNNNNNRRRRPKSAQPYKKNTLLQIQSKGYGEKKRGPSVVQLSGPLQQHWSTQIDLANKNLKRRKAQEAMEKERLEREDELTDDSTISEESK